MARRLAHVVDNANIWMIERRSGASFTLETLSQSLSGKPFRQNFNGYVAMEPRVLRRIHLTHAAAPDGREDLVRAESLACGKRHAYQVYRGASGKWVCPVV